MKIGDFEFDDVACQHFFASFDVLEKEDADRGFRTLVTSLTSIINNIRMRSFKHEKASEVERLVTELLNYFIKMKLVLAPASVGSHKLMLEDLPLKSPAQLIEELSSLLPNPVRCQGSEETYNRFDQAAFLSRTSVFFKVELSEKIKLLSPALSVHPSQSLAF